MLDTTSTVITNGFGYSSRSELTNALMGAESFAWTFDNIGNRKTYATSGTPCTYAANELNQYTSIAGEMTNSLTWDLDGNLLADGRYRNAWNGNNRLVTVESIDSTNGSERVEFAYDYMGRLYEEKVSTFNGSTWNYFRTNLWSYDGWLPLRRDAIHGETQAVDQWIHGLDLSGDLQGAGGIGGFLSWSRSTDTKAFLYCGDANGNITELIESGNPTNIVGAYRWDAYGNSLANAGAEAASNVIRWSSKYVIAHTADKYFGHRMLRDHRWIGRDPIGELAARHLYSFVQNSPVDRWDYLGMAANCCRQEDIDDLLDNHFSPGELGELEKLKDSKGRSCYSKPQCGDCTRSSASAQYTPPSGNSPGRIVVCSRVIASTLIHEMQHAKQCAGLPCGGDRATKPQCHNALCAEYKAYVCGDRGTGSVCDRDSRNFNRDACIRTAWNGSVKPACPSCAKYQSGDVLDPSPSFPLDCATPTASDCAVSP